MSYEVKIREVYDILRSKYVSITEAIKNPHLYRSHHLKCVSCGDEMLLVYGTKRQYFRHSVGNELHSQCPLYTGYHSNSVGNIFYNKFKNIVENRVTYLCAIQNNVIKYFLHIPTFTNDEINTLTSSSARISIVTEKERKDLKLTKDIFTKNNSVLIELKERFKIAHLQLYVKGDFIGVYKILGLDFSSLLNCYVSEDSIFVYDNPRYAYLNKRYVLIESKNNPFNNIDGIKIEKTMNLGADKGYLIKFTKKTNEISKFIREKGSILYNSSNKMDTCDRTVLEDVTEKICEKNIKQNLDNKTETIPNEYIKYIKVGGYFYHKSIHLAGNKITKIANDKIYYTFLNGQVGAMPFSQYRRTLNKLIKAEQEHNIKLGELYSSESLEIFNGLVCGFTSTGILYLNDGILIYKDFINKNNEEINTKCVEGAAEVIDVLDDKVEEGIKNEGIVKITDEKLDSKVDSIEESDNTFLDDKIINPEIPTKYVPYIKIGSLFYHLNIKYVGGKIISVEDGKIHCVLPDGKKGHMLIDKYFIVLDKLIILEEKHHIKLGQEFSSKKRKIPKSLVYGLTKTHMVTVKDGEVIKYDLTVKKTKVKKNANRGNNTQKVKNNVLCKPIIPTAGVTFYNRDNVKCIIYKISGNIAYYRHINGRRTGIISVNTRCLIHDPIKNRTYLKKH